MGRLDLHSELIELLGSPNVYFQPPESVKISYPCFVYELRDIGTRHADDDIYRMYDQYVVQLITRDPDTPLRYRILRNWPYISFDRSYRADNLYHYTYTLYY